VVHQLFFNTARAWMNRLPYMVSCDTRMASSSGYCVSNHPEICSGDQFNTSLFATIFRNLRFLARRHLSGHDADFQAWLSASWAR